eukprot:9466403-Pyramimonas_sp.AAC.1
MLGAIFLVVEDFVDFATARGHGTYQWKSFGKLDSRMKQFFVQAAIGSYPMDARMVVLSNSLRPFRRAPSVSGLVGWGD